MLTFTITIQDSDEETANVSLRLETRGASEDECAVFMGIVARIDPANNPEASLAQQMESLQNAICGE